MKTRTLAQLKQRARLYADQRVPDEDNAFVTGEELTGIINDEIGDFYDLLVEAGGPERYLLKDTIAIVGGTATYDLPDDFYQLSALNLEWGVDDVEPVLPLNSLQDIWEFQNYSRVWDRWTQKRYRLEGDQITFYPTPANAVTARIYYVPAFTDLEDDTDEFNGVNGWEKLVTLGAAMALLEIEEEGSGARLQARYDRAYDRIQGLADDRDSANEMQIRDVRRRRIRYPSATGTTQ